MKDKFPGGKVINRPRVALLDRILAWSLVALNRGGKLLWLIKQIKSTIGWIFFPFAIFRIMVTGNRLKKQGKRKG